MRARMMYVAGVAACAALLAVQAALGAEERAPAPAPTAGSATAQMLAGRQQPPLPGETVETVRRRLEYVARDLFARGFYEYAHPVALSAYELGSADPANTYRLAWCEARAGRPEQAVKLYDAVLASPQSAGEAGAELRLKSLLNRGVCLARLGRAEDAAESYRRAIELDGSFAPAYFNLGLLYAQTLGRPQDAVEALRAHIAHGGERSVSARRLIRELLGQPATPPAGEPAGAGETP